MGQGSSSLTSREKTLLAASQALESEDIPNRLLALREDLENGVDTFGDMEHVERVSMAITNVRESPVQVYLILIFVLQTSRLHTLSVELLRALLEECLDEPMKKATLQILSGKTLSRTCNRIASLLQEDSFWDRNETTGHSAIAMEAWRIVEDLENQIKLIKEMFRVSVIAAHMQTC